MNFREWLRLDEIQHIVLPKAMPINGIVADSIDFRFEDWKKGFNPDKQRDTLAPLSSGERFFRGSFSAPVQNGWLNVNLGNQPTTYGNVGLAISVKPQIQIATMAEFQQVPKIWYDFAIFYYGNDVVKTPEWPRDSYEMRAKDVAALDPVR